MGILWEIVQTGLMYGQKRKSDTIEDRVQSLEDRLTATQNTLRSLVKKLEEMQNVDIDGDGRIG
jgi:bisphosphoglycerate-dependent phosphoglycerate mutase